MSLSSLERNKYGPGWFEVLFVAWLGLAFGVLLACVYLAFRPVATGAQITKDLPPETLTYVEGSTNAQKGAGWMRKRQALMEGQSVELSEEEINSALVSSKNDGKKPAPAKKGAPAPDAPILVPGALNFRLHDNLLQVAWPIQVTPFEMQVVIQVRGDFAKTDEGVVFVPRQTYIGSLPVHLIPGAQAEVYKRLSALHAKPADINSAWVKLVSAQVDGKLLKLQMP